MKNEQKTSKITKTESILQKVPLLGVILLFTLASTVVFGIVYDSSITGALKGDILVKIVDYYTGEPVLGATLTLSCGQTTMVIVDGSIEDQDRLNNGEIYLIGINIRSYCLQNSPYDEFSVTKSDPPEYYYTDELTLNEDTGCGPNLFCGEFRNTYLARI